MPAPILAISIPSFHPAARYASPSDVFNDETLSVPEKRIILSSWASDMFAVESCPALREIPGMGHTIRLADILAGEPAGRICWSSSSR